jgi:hypothetical protein
MNKSNENKKSSKKASLSKSNLKVLQQDNKTLQQTIPNSVRIINEYEICSPDSKNGRIDTE